MGETNATDCVKQKMGPAFGLSLFMIKAFCSGQFIGGTITLGSAAASYAFPSETTMSVVTAWAEWFGIQIINGFFAGGLAAHAYREGSPAASFLCLLFNLGCL